VVCTDNSSIKETTLQLKSAAALQDDNIPIDLNLKDTANLMIT
jgi:hypothetical protein